MTSERWQKVKDILDILGATAIDRRQKTLEQACSGDNALRQEVESFLEFDEEIDEFIEDPLWSFQGGGPSDTDLDDSSALHLVGPYRLHRLLGRGGMGAVYLAEREGDYEQQVALKLVNWGMDSEEILARFLTERQILANLQHPGIARLLDGGTTEENLPYFAMEYVEGEPIDVYCENCQLPLSKRLELFRKVCAAVHFAHQNLIVHRDLKPSNILVTADGEPKLLDFGIAKLLQSEQAARTFATVTGQGPMTPDYASPEQIMNAPITTACDVYALGVLLYRLLTGLPPYRLREKGYAEIVDVICKVEPRKPSTAVRPDTVTRQERETSGPFAEPREEAGLNLADIRRLRRQLTGDLDAIIMKAMRKEPHLRYGSAFEFSEDIQRHLTGLPVQALQGNWSYVASKFMRRHKLGLAMVFLVVIFAITVTIFWRQAVDERAEAQRERTKAQLAQTQAERAQSRAERVSDYLEKLFESANPNEVKGKDLTVQELLDRGWENSEEDLKDEPDIHADILGTLGTVYHNLGLFAKASELRRQVILIRQELYPEGHPALATALGNLATTFDKIGDLPGAEEYYRKALEMRKKIGQVGSDIHISMFNLASALRQLGKYEEAESLLLKVLESRREIHGENDPRVASILYRLGLLYFTLGNIEQAESLMRQALRIRIEFHGENNARVAGIISSLGQVVQLKGDPGQAKELYDRSLAIRRRLLGENHLDVAHIKKKIADVLLNSGQPQAAGKYIDQMLPITRKECPQGSACLVDAEAVLGSYFVALGRYQEAEPLLLENLRTHATVPRDRTIHSWLALEKVIALYEQWGITSKIEEYRSMRHRHHPPNLDTKYQKR